MSDEEKPYYCNECKCVHTKGKIHLSEYEAVFSITEDGIRD